MSFFPNAAISIIGSPFPTVAEQIAGNDGTNLRVLLTDTSGQLKVLVENFPGTQPISGTVTSLQGTSPWTIQGDSASGASKAGNPVQIGGVFNTTQPTVTSGQTVEAQFTARGAAIVATGVDSFFATVFQGTSPWVVTGTFFQTTQPVSIASGQVASGAFASGSIASGAIASGALAAGSISSGAAVSGAFADGSLVTLGAKADAKSTATDTTPVTIMSVLKEISFMAQTPAALPANQSVNVAQINGVTPLMGNGVTGTGSQRVTIASDNTAFSVNATLSAETTKVIGTVNQGTSPWVVSLASTTVTGTVTVAGAKTNNNAAPGATNVGVLPGIANAATQTWTEGDQVLESMDLSGRQRIRGTLTNNNAAPTADGQMALSALANAAAPSWTEGQLVLESVDLAGNHRIIGTKTNNNAAPTTQLGVLPAIANAAAPSWTEGNQVLLSTDLAGNLRVLSTGTGTVAAAVPATAGYQGLIATTSYPTAATAGNLVGQMGDKAGRAVVVQNGPRDFIGTASVQSTTNSLVSLVAAGGAGVFNDLISVTFTNENSSATIVSLSDGTVTYKFSLAANGGGTFNFPSPLPATSTATAWQFSNSASNTVDAVIIYVKNK